MFRLRAERGISQRDLAAAIHTNHSAIYMLEAEKSLPRADTILALCRYFGVCADYLLGLSDVRSPMPDDVVVRLEQVYGTLFDIQVLAHSALNTVREA